MTKLSPYPEYKRSGIEWISEVPKQWALMPSKRVLRFVKEIVGDRHEEFDRLSLTMSGVLPRSKESADGLSPESFSTYQILRPNELVFKMIDLENRKTSRVGISNDLGLVSSAYIVARPRPALVSRFAYYYFTSLYNEGVYNQLGSGVRSTLNSDDLARITIPLPSRLEQHAIANLLDRETAQIDELIDKQERLIELLAEKRQAIIAHAVTKGLDPTAPTKPSGIPWLGEVNASWPLRPLKAAGHINLGKMIQPSPKVETDFEAPYLRAANVQPNGALALDDVKNMWFNDSELQALDVRSGDVVVVEGGIGGFGRAAYVNRDLPGVGYQNSINRIRPSKSVDGRFLTYLLLTARHAGFIHAYCTGVSMPHLTAEKLAAIRVPLPDWTTQTQISDRLDAQISKLNDLSAKASAVITMLNERRSALISAAVTGKIDVQEGAA